MKMIEEKFHLAIYFDNFVCAKRIYLRLVKFIYFLHDLDEEEGKIIFFDIENKGP